MFKFRNILTGKIKPLYLYSGILAVLILIYIFVDFEKIYDLGSNPTPTYRTVPKKPENTPWHKQINESLFTFVEEFAPEYKFISPVKIVKSSWGHLYILDRGADKVLKFDELGNLVGFFGKRGVSGPFLAPEALRLPPDMAIDSDDNIYVVAHNWGTIQKFDASGNYINQWSKYPNPSEQSHLSEIHTQTASVAFCNGGYIFAADPKRDYLLKFDTDGNFIAKWGGKGAGPGRFDFYGSYISDRMACDSVGNIYVMDEGNKRVQKFDSDGNFLLEFGGPWSTEGKLFSLDDIVIAPDGNVYVLDQPPYMPKQVVIFSSDGSWIDTWRPARERGAPRFMPISLMIDDKGRLYVLEDKKIRIYIPSLEY